MRLKIFGPKAGRCGMLLLLIGGCTGNASKRLDSPGPEGGGDGEPSGGGGASPTSDGGGGAGGGDSSVSACSQELGYPCLAAANEVCPLGGMGCYGILLKTVCGPADRGCSMASTTCVGQDQKCFAPLHTQTDEGICLTESEMECFCHNLDLYIQPEFCPREEAELPGVGEYCSCSGGCAYDPDLPLCKKDLACVRYGCKVPCSPSSPTACPDNQKCVDHQDGNGMSYGYYCLSFE